MELKVVCNCGQKYKFDVEPVEGVMPFTVNCPVCGIDGTNLANGLLATTPAPAMAAARPAALSVNRAPPTPPPVPIAAAPQRPTGAPGAMRQPAPAIPKYLQTNQATANNNFLLGVLGCVIGAVVAVALMYGFYMFTGFKFPLTGTLMGAIIGYGGRLAYKGTSSALGGVAAAIAFLTILGTLFFMFGLFSVLLSGFVSLVIGVGMAFKLASD
jgi:hypothetical protein